MQTRKLVAVVGQFDVDCLEDPGIDGRIVWNCIFKKWGCELDLLCSEQWSLNLMFMDPCIIVQFLQKNPTRCNSVSTFLLFLILNEAQRVSGDTLPIIRSLKLHKQPLVLHTWKVVGRCQVAYATWQRPTTARPTAFHVCKTRGCLCSFRLLMMGGVSPETCWASFKIRNNKNVDTLLHLVEFFCKKWSLSFCEHSNNPAP